MDKSLFKNIMSQSASLVYIITTNGKLGKFGITVTSVSAVTDDPATILVCVNNKSSIYNSIEENNIICVNFLSHIQQELAQEFSRSDKSSRTNRFKKTNFKLTFNNQIFFNESLAFLEGYVEDKIIKGTHTVYFLKIIDGMVLNQKHNALIYCNRNFKILL